MGKGQRQLQDTATRRSAEQYDRGRQAQLDLKNNPEFKALKARLAQRRKHLDTGTVADAKDFVSNRAAVAERKRQRDSKVNLTKTGVAGLASNYANPTQVALADKLYEDEFVRDSAAQTESDFKEYIAQTDAMERDVINTELGIDSGIMNSAFGVSQNSLSQAAQIAASRASILPSLLGGAISGFAGIASNSNWFNRRPAGGSAGPA